VLSETLLDGTNPLQRPHGLVADLWICSRLLGELLVEGQRLFEEIPLERRQRAFFGQSFLSHLGIHLIDGLAGPLALEAGLAQRGRGLVLCPHGPDCLPGADTGARNEGQAH
jgi:hypothetical protein